MKIIFFGSSSYCLPILSILQNNFHLLAVVTKPHSVVGKFGTENRISTFTPENKEKLKTLQSNLQTINPDLAIVADFGMIIPESILSIPKYHTLNIHFSKLPYLRGASPVQFTILRGDKKAGITIIIMDKRMDEGDIVFQKEVPIHENITSEELYNNLFNIVSSALPDVINQYAQNGIKPVKQNHSNATYTKILTREDGFIPWDIFTSAIKSNGLSNSQLESWSLFKYLSSHSSQPTTLIERASRALYPWPGLWTEVDINGQKKRLKILKAHLQPTIYNLQPDIVQLESKKPVSWKQFLDGYKKYLS